MRQVSLQVNLALLAVRWSRQRDDAEHARADAFGDRFDRASLSRAIAAFEYDDDARSFVLHPFLKQAQFGLQPAQLFFVFFPLHIFRNRRALIANRIIENIARASRFGHKALQGAFFSVTPRTIITI